MNKTTPPPKKNLPNQLKENTRRKTYLKEQQQLRINIRTVHEKKKEKRNEMKN